MKRTPFMALIMLTTQDLVFMEAIQRGFDGSHERVIAKKLKEHYLADHSETCEIFKYIMDDDLTAPLDQVALRAAYLITSSKIEDHDKVAG